MSELARILLELVDRPWAELDEDERVRFTTWLKGARGVDLYTIVRYDRRRRVRRSSSSATLAAQRDLAAPPEIDALRAQVASIERERDALKRQVRELLRKRSDER